MDFSPEQIRWVIQGMIALVLSIAVHEFGHAFVADRLGDSTPRSEGRLTLNPLAHADLIGTLLLPLAALMFQLPPFGWGKPVMTRPERYSRRFSMITGSFMVSLAGPAMNLMFGMFIAAVHVGLLATGTLPSGHELNHVLGMAVLLNFTLFFFNLLPVSPLDGAKVILRFLPRRWHDDFDRFSVYSPFLLLGLMMIPRLQQIFLLPAGFIGDNVYRGFGALAGL
jgi:Zn-dependent protease